MASRIAPGTERGDRDGDPHLLVASLDQCDEVSVRLASHRRGFL